MFWKQAKAQFLQQITSLWGCPGGGLGDLENTASKFSLDPSSCRTISQGRAPLGMWTRLGCQLTERNRCLPSVRRDAAVLKSLSLRYILNLQVKLHGSGVCFYKTFSVPKKAEGRRIKWDLPNVNHNWRWVPSTEDIDYGWVFFFPCVLKST